MPGIEINGTSVSMPKWLVGWGLSMLTAAVLGLVGMVFGINAGLNDIDKRVAVIEGNRFTSGMALSWRQEIEEGLPTLREFTLMMATVQRIEERLTHIEERLR